MIYENRLRTKTTLRAKHPKNYRSGADAKLLAAIARLTLEIIPADPGAPQFRQGCTLGTAHKHWFCAKFGNGRYRLSRVIIYTWVNDECTLRTYGAKRDAYAVFKAMLDKDSPPNSRDALAKAVGAGVLVSAGPRHVTLDLVRNLPYIGVG